MQIQNKPLGCCTVDGGHGCYLYDIANQGALQGTPVLRFTHDDWRESDRPLNHSTGLRLDKVNQRCFLDRPHGATQSGNRRRTRKSGCRDDISGRGVSTHIGRNVVDGVERGTEDIRPKPDSLGDR